MWAPLPARPGRLWMAVLSVVLVQAACGNDDSRELRAPSPDQTTTTTAAVSSTSAGQSTEEPSEPLALTSPAFAFGEPIPLRYTCDGEELSPPLAWTGVPAGAAELALVVRDPDAGGFVHWVIAGIPATTAGMAEDTPPSRAVEARNGAGGNGWAGPCPPSGNHTYVFTLYALSQPAGMETGLDAEDAAELIESSPAVTTAVLEGTYRPL